MTLYALGVAQREANRPLASLRSFRAFLAEPKPAKQSATNAKTFRHAAQEAVDDLVSKVGRIIVRSSTPHAVVAVDGTGCALAEPCFVSPGKHEVVVHAAGHETATEHVSVKAGGTEDITVTLDASESSPWPFVLMGIGGASLIGGITLTAVGVSASMDTTDPSAGTVTEIAIGNTLMAAGLASVAAGYTWWALEPSADTTGAAVVVSPTWTGVKVAF